MVPSLGQEDPLEKGMATHSSILAWRIPWTEEPGGLQSVGLQRVGHDWSNLACLHRLPSWHNGKESAYQCRRHKWCGFNPWVKKIPGSRKWLPTQVLSGNRGAWRATVHGVAKNQTRVSEWVSVHKIEVILECWL